jgi:hypothetical protein
LELQFLQKPQGAVAAAGAEDGSYGWVCQRVIQLGEAALVVACHIPVSPENSWVVLNAVAIGNNAQTRVE